MTNAGGWLVLALVLAIAELVVPGVFLVFVAVAAAVTGAIVLALPEVPLVAQLGAFAVWSVVTVMIGRRWYLDHPVAGDPRLNDPVARMIGRTVTVETDFTRGHGRVRVGDGAWPARGSDLLAGAQARVTAVEGGVLVVEPL